MKNPIFLFKYSVCLCLLGIFQPVHSQSVDEATGVPSTSRQEANTITIRSSRTLSERFMGTGSRVVVGRQDIEEMGADTVVDVLKQLPGVQVTGEGSASVVIRMRGMNAAATQVLIDGERITQARSGSQLPLDQLPSDMIERIEVVRVPVAEFSGASAGTINIVLRQSSVKRETSIRLTNQHVWGQNGLGGFFSRTGPLREPDKENPLDRPWSYFFGGYAGEKIFGSDATRSSQVSGAALGNAPTQNITDEQTRSHSKEAGISPRLNGRLDNGDQVGLRMTLGAGQTSGQFSSNSKGNNIQGITAGSVQHSSSSHRSTLNLRADHSTRLKSTKLESYLAGQRNSEIIERGQEQSYTASGATTNAHSNFTDDRIERAYLLSTKLSNSEGDKLWMLGVERESRRFSVLSSNTAVVSSDLNLGTVFTRNVLWGQNEWGLNWSSSTASTLTAGLRLEQLRLDSAYSTMAGGKASQNNQWSVVQPSLHLRTPLDIDTQWRVNIARVGRNPQVTDLIDRSTPSQGTNSPGNPSYAGNPLLRSETSFTLDAGIEKRLGESAGSGGQLGLNLFARELNDVIGRRISPNPTQTIWTSRPDNMGKATVWGLEGDLKTSLKALGLDSFGADWNLSSSATLLLSRMRDAEFGGNRIPGQARYIANLSVAKPMRRTGGLFGGATVNMQGASDYFTSTSAAVSGVASGGSNNAYASLDAYIGRVHPMLGFWRIGAYNITNSVRRQIRTNDSPSYSGWDSVQTLLTPRVFFVVGTQF